jgi:prophage regulatory protein
MTTTPLKAEETTPLTAEDPDGESYLRFPAVRQRTGLSRTTIHRLVKAGHFPAPKRLGPRAVGWKASVVKGWCASRPDAREQQAT